MKVSENEGGKEGEPDEQPGERAVHIYGYLPILCHGGLLPEKKRADSFAFFDVLRLALKYCMLFFLIFDLPFNFGL